MKVTLFRRRTTGLQRRELCAFHARSTKFVFRACVNTCVACTLCMHGHGKLGVGSPYCNAVYPAPPTVYKPSRGEGETPGLPLVAHADMRSPSSPLPEETEKEGRRCTHESEQTWLVKHRRGGRGSPANPRASPSPRPSSRPTLDIFRPLQLRPRTFAAGRGRGGKVNALVLGKSIFLILREGPGMSAPNRTNESKVISSAGEKNLSGKREQINLVK